MINRILNIQFSIFNFQFSGKSIIKNPLFSGSAIMILGSNLSNFIAYIYHLIIGRMLGPSPYGTLVAVLSLLGLVTTAFSFLGVVVVKFIAAADKEEVMSVFKWLNGKIIKFGILLFLIALIISPLLSNFFHIELQIILLVAPMILFSVLVFYYRAVLQGLMRFKEVVVSTNQDMLGRLGLGILLIYLGYSVFGAVLGIVLSTFLTTLVLQYFLRNYRIKSTAKEFTKGKKVIKYSLPVIVSSLAIYSFFSTDVLLVKHFFNSYDAGIYASLSTLGKIIFYGTSPVVVVMFPMISKRHAKKQDHDKILLLSIALTAGIALTVTLIYYLLPELMISILYGQEFIVASPYLYLFGLFMSIFSMSSLFLNYYLSKEDTKIVSIALVAVVLQALGIWFYHNSIYQVAIINIIAISFLFIALVGYFIYDRKTSIKKVS